MPFFFLSMGNWNKNPVPFPLFCKIQTRRCTDGHNLQKNWVPSHEVKNVTTAQIQPPLLWRSETSSEFQRSWKKSQDIKEGNKSSLLAFAGFWKTSEARGSFSTGCDETDKMRKLRKTVDWCSDLSGTISLQWPKYFRAELITKDSNLITTLCRCTKRI